MPDAPPAGLAALLAEHRVTFQVVGAPWYGSCSCGARNPGHNYLTEDAIRCWYEAHVAAILHAAGLRRVSDEPDARMIAAANHALAQMLLPMMATTIGGELTAQHLLYSALDIPALLRAALAAQEKPA
jgi:hypothetical protein